MSIRARIFIISSIMLSLFAADSLAAGSRKYLLLPMVSAITSPDDEFHGVTDGPELEDYNEQMMEYDNALFEGMENDTVRLKHDDQDRNWWHLLKRGKLNTSDTTVVYPKFLNFCMKVYRWADKTFNSYDTTYVQGTGRRWKIRLLSDNWLDSYYINPGKKIPIRMMSDPYSNFGGYLQYMAVSVGYSLDMNNIFGSQPANHKKFEYSFNCARFNIEGHYWENTGGTYIRSFGDYNKGHLIKKGFEGLTLRDVEVYGYYFFNNRKFSMGAAYNFSKFQRKSAGSAIIGLGYSNTDISIDLNTLPEELKPYLLVNPVKYRFHYNSYFIMSGYSFNWVINKHFLFNISTFPGFGLTTTYEDSVDKNSKTVAINMRALGSLTYNYKDFFICAVGKFTGNWYVSGGNTFFSSVENGQISIGMRF